MRPLFLCLALTGISFGQAILPSAPPQPEARHAPSVAKAADPAAAFPEFQPMEGEKTSLIGGTVRSIDHVRDRLIIEPFGGHRTAVLFDGRTKVSADGQSASLRDLTEGQRIYAETVLDNHADVFARSIRIAGQRPEDSSSGQITSFNPATGEMTVRDTFFPEPLKLKINPQTRVTRWDQVVPNSELKPGTLVKMKFAASKGADLVANEIAILAQPGVEFVFVGSVVYLDLHAHLLVVNNANNGTRYEIDYGPSVAQADIREGANVRVTASFDGRRYSATDVSIVPAAPVPSVPANDSR